LQQTDVRASKAEIKASFVVSMAHLEYILNIDINNYIDLYQKV